MYIPDLVEKHLKLLSQNPHTITTSFSGMAAKQEAEAERFWSRGSPNRAFNPMAVKKITNNINLVHYNTSVYELSSM